MVTKKEPIEPEPFLTKTEVFVVDCRKRGMSGTAIRRLLQLSAAEAVALGVIPGQTGRSQSERKAEAQQPSAEPWPQKEGRRKVFPRRHGHRSADLLNRATSKSHEISTARRGGSRSSLHQQNRSVRGESV